MKGWFERENAGEFAGALLVFGLIRVMCRGLSVLLGKFRLLSEGEPRHGYGEPRPIKADLAKNRFLAWRCLP